MSSSRESPLQVSVIIPVVNEAGAIDRCLAQFRGQRNVEVIVVDGGSCDGTRERVRATGTVRLVTSPRSSRSVQMNRGARSSTGDVLLFLHADTYLPAGGIRMILESLEKPDVVGGRFRMGLSEDTWIFRAIALLSTMRSRYLRVTYGDQGIYVRRCVFDRVAGFPDVALFEDSEFCAAVSKLGRFVLLDGSVLTSTRRWRRWGVVTSVIWMWTIRILYLCSVSDKWLSRLYRDVR